MDVARKVQKIFVVCDHFGFGGACENVAGGFVFIVKIHSVGGVCPLDKLAYWLGAILAQEQVNMVGHKAVCDNRNIVLAFIFFKPC